MLKGEKGKCTAEEMEIGKLPINTNYRPIQYPCEILCQNSRDKMSVDQDFFCMFQEIASFHNISVMLPLIRRCA